MSHTAVMTRRDARLGKQIRAGDLTPTTYDPEAHTVEIVAATGYEVKRWGWDGPYIERLRITDEAVDLSRVAKGQCPLLDTHGRWSLDDQIGKHTEARIEDGKLILKALFAQSEKGQAIEARVAAGEVSGTSVGYRTHEMVMVEVRDDVPVYEVTRWELLENSLCPVPADPDSGVRSEDDLFPCVIHERKATPMTVKPAENAPAQEDGQRAAPAAGAPVTPTPPVQPVAADPTAVRMTVAEAFEFAGQARQFGLEEADARKWAETLTPDAARSEMIRAATAKQESSAPNLPHGQAGRVGRDERDTTRTAITDALMHRFDPGAHKVTELGRQYRGMSLMEIARENLRSNGEKVNGLSKRELADIALRSHSTSDFPYILSNVAGKTLRGAYEGSPQTFKIWQRRVTAPDFKQISRIQMGGAPGLLLVPEGGEYKMGTIGEGKEVYSLATYGRRFSITRQTLINDDLDAFTRIPQLFGRAAADFESDAAYAPLIGNPNMGDGFALFSTQHGNLAGSGAAISETSLSAADVAYSNQVGLEGRPINISPKYLIHAPKDKMIAKKTLASVTATKTEDYNTMAGELVPISEVRLKRASGATPWFTAADYNQIDTIEYAYLEGEEGVYMEERQGFEVDGMEFKVRLDFATKAIDHRGLYQNPGT